jgi:hypothetical protein
LEDLSIDGRLILKWMLRKQGGMAWTRSIWFITQTIGGIL